MASAAGPASATVDAAVGVDGADVGGVEGTSLLVGDAAVVDERMAARRRRTVAIDAELEKLRRPPAVQISAASLAADQVAVQRSRGAAAKTSVKIATDERSFDLFVTEMQVELPADSYPSIETMVMYASWMTRRRQKACLAQRPDSGPRRTGLGKATIRNMVTELFSPRQEAPAIAGVE